MKTQIPNQELSNTKRAICLIRGERVILPSGEVKEVVGVYQDTRLWTIVRFTDGSELKARGVYAEVIIKN